ncbi:MAG TPA: DUF3301 domain-containing protein [Gammaproteobacteria bacterium]|nr:DUF3301 domain-containing protein [Gammaproteobacteria bacterium]
MGPLIITVLIGLLAWFWGNSMRAKEIALDQGARACQSMGVQFLDETVSISRIGLGRESSGRMNLQRVYNFEFTVSGDRRCLGKVAMQGGEVKAIHLDHPDGPVVMEPGR